VLVAVDHSVGTSEQSKLSFTKRWLRPSLAPTRLSAYLPSWAIAFPPCLLVNGTNGTNSTTR